MRPEDFTNFFEQEFYHLHLARTGELFNSNVPLNLPSGLKPMDATYTKPKLEEELWKSLAKHQKKMALEPAIQAKIGNRVTDAPGQ